ncbi:MAG: hypothetical protein KGL39_04935 [Patescibacteria group bacterium]|nr:hypothetical protein [Patescibacteria group bacterium]
MPLSTYLNDASVLLNDMNYSFQSKSQLTRWVNSGRKSMARRTGCIRRLISGQSAFGVGSQAGFATPNATQPSMIPDALPAGAIYGAATNLTMQTIPNVERYPYQGFFNPVLRAMHAGCDQVIDTIALSVNWGGTNRPSLDWMSWDEFQAYCRAYAVLNSSFPSVWSVYNDGPLGEIWMFPVPSTVGDIEADCFVTPADLHSDDDFDAIPEGFRDSIKFAAAELAFMASGRYAQAEVMAGKIAESLGVTRAAVDAGKSKSYYPTYP